MTVRESLAVREASILSTTAAWHHPGAFQHMQVYDFVEYFAGKAHGRGVGVSSCCRPCCVRVGVQPEP